MAHSTAGIGHITAESGNEVDVKVKNRLAGGSPAVDTNIVSVGPMALLDDAFRLLDGADERYLFGGRGVKPRWRMTAGDQQRMAGRDGKGILKTQDQIAAKEDPIFRRMTEGTFHGV